MQKKHMRKTVIIALATSAFLGGCACPSMKENMVPQDEHTRKGSPGNRFYPSVKIIGTILRTGSLPRFLPQFFQPANLSKIIYMPAIPMGANP